MVGLPARRSVAALALVAALAALAGCAGAPAAPSRPPAAAPTATPPPPDPIVVEADRRLAAMTLREKVGSMIMMHVGGDEAGPLRDAIDRDGLAGLILMDDNVGSVDETRELVAGLSADPALPALTAVDQEGGLVARLRDRGPAAAELRGEPAAETAAAFAERGDLVARAGIAINFGVVADVTDDRGAFIWERTLGDDAGSASPRVAAAVSGEHGAVLSTLKHFPGHGAVDGDSHDSLPTTDLSLARWSAEVAPPFQAGIDAGAELVMFGHLRFTAVDGDPATLSPEWHRILRQQLGFDGVIVTDDLNMLEYSGIPRFGDRTNNAVRAVAAGNDLLLYVGPVKPRKIVDAVTEAVEKGEIAESTIDAAAHRLLMMRLRLAERQAAQAAG
jgi:beta-N-acetylhexosaminidase